MSDDFFTRHKPLLDKAVEAIQTRGYWSPFSEVPSPKVYGEAANDDGKKAFEARLNTKFPIEQPGTIGQTGSEKSPFGIELGITYPKADVDKLLPAVQTAAAQWRSAGPETWVGVSLEILSRLNKKSFEIAYAVMHTSGQAFMMAFQAGGPHAQDRGLEAVAYAWSEMSRIPKTATWEKPQGKNEPLKMEKRYRIIPRGIGLVIGCCTFPTWNSYPGLFASLATGNAVIVKPHPGAILPLAITVQVAREVLREAGFDANVVTLVSHEKGDEVAEKLALRPEIKVIDFTGSSENGVWLERNAHQAQVFTEKAGVNQIIVDSTNDFKGMTRNISFSLALYSGQMCTAPQNIYVPKEGIDTAEGHINFDQVATGIGEALNKLLSDPARGVEILGAIQNDSILQRIDKARQLGEVIVDSKPLSHPQFADARVRTPLLLKTDASNSSKFMQELFGPIAFVIATENTAQSIALAKQGAIEHGAITMSVYSSNEKVLDEVADAAAEAGVSLSCNLTGGVYVNQSAAYSDFHASGANPAANASLTDTAFVASRFRVAQSRAHI
ncbi:MAG TPA: phenylacetic acid degradation protein PaaN [Bryobacteraceae bacterium]|nr:phenylacetic acid degradation protein PaaN [Bryobacteraceae bacterium]